MLHRENHSALLCGLNQKPLPPHPSLSAGTIGGDTPECDCVPTCVPLCVLFCVVWKWNERKGGEGCDEES